MQNVRNMDPGLQRKRDGAGGNRRASQAAVYSEELWARKGQLARPFQDYNGQDASGEPMMQERTIADFDMDRVNQVWADYERTHDLNGKEHLAVGIDPEAGEVFIGNSAKEIIARLRDEGRFRPLFFRWVNDPFYIHKGARR
jgi:hypothetical protein